MFKINENGYLKCDRDGVLFSFGSGRQGFCFGG